MNLFPSFVIDKRRFYSQNSTQLFVLFPNKGKRVRVISSNYIQLLLIGLCLGITLGIAFIPMFEINCYSSSLETAEDSSTNNNANLPVPSLSTTENIDKSNENNSPNNIFNGDFHSMKMRRPRFFSTELGLRKKLIVGIILTDLKRVENVIAINRTLNPFVDQVLFFVLGQSAAQQLKSFGMSNVVVLSNKKSGVSLNESLDDNGNLDKTKYNRVILRAIKYFGEKFVNSYDFFFVGLDLFYINGRNLMNSAKKISISQEIVWGDADETGMCKLETGFLLSRSVTRKLSLRLDRCLLSNTLKMGNNIKKCVQYALGTVRCLNLIQNQTYHTVPLENLDELVTGAIFIGPVYNAQDIYHLHVRVSENRLIEIDQEINKLTGIIDLMTPHIPKGFKINSWPKGLISSYEPHTRFDVLKWKYFTANKLYPKNEHITETSLDGIETLDLYSVINSSIHYLRDVLQKDERSITFQYGYRRFDETRGMEYILDFSDTEGENHRIECLRPLSKIEMVPMPFVMENRRVTIVIPITLEQYNETDTFLTNYLDLSVDKKSNAVLVLAIIISDSVMEAQVASQFQRIKLMITEHSSNQSKKDSIASSTVVGGTELVKVGYVVVNMKQFGKTSNNVLAAVDMLSSRVLSPNALVLVLDTFVNLKDEFLNRVRMNTILNYQVFSPIPFVEYNPRISGYHYHDDKELEIHKATGYFDSKSFGIVSFFIGDYLAARKQSNFPLKPTASPDSVGVSILSHLFLQRSQVHFLRALEPSLKFRYSNYHFQNCYTNGECFKRQWGSKAELAKLILRSRV